MSTPEAARVPLRPLPGNVDPFAERLEIPIVAFRVGAGIAVDSDGRDQVVVTYGVNSPTMAKPVSFSVVMLAESFEHLMKQGKDGERSAELAVTNGIGNDLCDLVARGQIAKEASAKQAAERGVYRGEHYALDGTWHVHRAGEHAGIKSDRVIAVAGNRDDAEAIVLAMNARGLPATSIALSDEETKTTHSAWMAEDITQFFAFEHLPARLQEVSRTCYVLARAVVSKVPRNAERTAGLRLLVQAKDSFVRAMLFKGAAER